MEILNLDPDTLQPVDGFVVVFTAKREGDGSLIKLYAEPGKPPTGFQFFAFVERLYGPPPQPPLLETSGSQVTTIGSSDAGGIGGAASSSTTITVADNNANNIKIWEDQLAQYNVRAARIWNEMVTLNKLGDVPVPSKPN